MTCTSPECGYSIIAGAYSWTVDDLPLIKLRNLRPTSRVPDKLARSTIEWYLLKKLGPIISLSNIFNTFYNYCDILRTNCDYKIINATVNKSELYCYFLCLKPRSQGNYAHANTDDCLSKNNRV